MNATPDISGIHHITAVSSNAARNLYFYTEVLGLRLVKQTVNSTTLTPITSTTATKRGIRAPF